MTHAYMITAYNNFDQLKKLIQVLDHEHCSIYLHVDKKAKDFNKASFAGLTKHSKVHITKRISVHWGGFSFIQSEMTLLRAAVKDGADYYHLISGTDIPLKNQEAIQGFFEEHSGKEFIQFDTGQPLDSEQNLKRVRYYHLFLDWKRGRSELFRRFESRSLRIQGALGINRIKNKEDLFYKGSGWFSITRDYANWLLDHQKELGSLFKHGHVCDELYMQTMVMLSPFKDNLYLKDNDHGHIGNLRLIDWTRGSGGSPYTFRLKDYDELKKSEMLFVRKVDSNVDKAIVDRLFEDLK